MRDREEHGASPRRLLSGLLLLSEPLTAARRWLGGLAFPGSKGYWQDRYRKGGTSGAGSRGQLARFKADTLNAFVSDHEIESVIEFGCGDGSQLALAEYPRYVGLDVSVAAIQRCIDRFGHDDTKSFFLYDPEAFMDRAGIFRADAALSLDVIYHLVEDATFDLSMRHLFAAARSFVIIYSSNFDAVGRRPHVRHRRFTDWIATNEASWTLHSVIPNDYPVGRDASEGSKADFYIFARSSRSESGGGRSVLAQPCGG